MEKYSISDNNYALSCLITAIISSSPYFAAASLKVFSAVLARGDEIPSAYDT
ncbi:hypothetical protein [Pedobacter borealis]|uniref:hypothetical protein n=1 Tax=Pedobacter borealis TaxID=475254 RepID=UPI000A625009|nr:hypothetical protein [Pedobacter borealis]